MKIPVLIEPVASNGYRARGGEPFPEVGEAQHLPRPWSN